jgi:hypothetical protein
MQLVMVGHIEDTDVRVLPGDAPQVAPCGGAPLSLRARLLLGLQKFEAIGIDTVRHTHFHANAVQHGGSSLSRVAAQLVRIERDAEARAGRQMHMELAEVQRLRHRVVGQDLLTEMLAPPAEFAQPRERRRKNLSSA